MESTKTTSSPYIVQLQLTNHRYPLGNISFSLSSNQNFYISDTRERFWSGG